MRLPARDVAFAVLAAPVVEAKTEEVRGAEVAAVAGVEVQVESRMDLPPQNGWEFLV